MRRVAVVGNSGSGKSTLAAALATKLGVPHVELDSIYHQPGWKPLPADQLHARVDEIVAGGGWVIDGNYSAVRDLIWSRADTVVWYDLPRRTVMRQIVKRTVSRMLTRRELWNGNREPLTGLFRLDPDASIVRWAWTQHGKYHRRYSAAAEDPVYADLTFIRVRSHREGRDLLRRLP
jgi:adenylate kinase family enzyme